MNDHIVVIGTGEMSGVFTRGLLKLGHPVIPVKRNSDMEKMAAALSLPVMVMVAVGEADLHPVLEKIPSAWQDRLVLLQNELLPRDWHAHGLLNPTVISVWFEKKKGQDYKVLVPSPVFGPHAKLIERSLEALEIPCWELSGIDELEFELVRKNVYILTTNISGLELPKGTNVDTLWQQHRELALEIAHEVMDIQCKLIGRELDRDRLIAGMEEGILGDPAHICTGRSAPARLKRNLGFADEHQLPAPRMREIAAKLG